MTTIWIKFNSLCIYQIKNVSSILIHVRLFKILFNVHRYLNKLFDKNKSTIVNPRNKELNESRTREDKRWTFLKWISPSSFVLPSCFNWSCCWRLKINKIEPLTDRKIDASINIQCMHVVWARFGWGVQCRAVICCSCLLNLIPRVSLPQWQQLAACLGLQLLHETKKMGKKLKMQ